MTTTCSCVPQPNVLSCLALTEATWANKLVGLFVWLFGLMPALYTHYYSVPLETNAS